MKREQHGPEYLALNPEGKVPTLLVDGSPLTEVTAILYYLAKRFPAADLFPAEDDLEPQARYLEDVVHCLDDPSGPPDRRRPN